jgi:hypothetical protein
VGLAPGAIIIFVVGAKFQFGGGGLSPPKPPPVHATEADLVLVIPIHVRLSRWCCCYDVRESTPAIRYFDMPEILSHN